MLHLLSVNSLLGLNAGGGVAERTFQMSRTLARQAGVQCTVLTLDLDLDAARVAALHPATLARLPCLLRRFHVPRGGWTLVKELVHRADVIQLMGHWSLLNFMVYLAARRANKPYVVCPAGALPIYGRSAWLKRTYNLIAGHAILRNAQGWIAVTSGELPHFEEYGVAASRVVIIPNGVNPEDFPAGDLREFRARYRLTESPTVLFMGRLNPIKGPDLLLNAFIRHRHQFPNYQLVFAGPDEGMLAGLQQMAETAGISALVHFLGHLGARDKSSAYHSARLLVVPSRQEAMSIVAVEAGICGTPVLLTDQCGFGEVRRIDARLEVPATVEGIGQGLDALLADDKCLADIAPAWRNYVHQHFLWSALVQVYLSLYRSVAKRGSGQ